MGATTYYERGSWKFCPRCKTDKQLYQFYLVKGVPYTYCKECKKSISREYQRAHPEQSESRRKVWIAAHPGYDKEVSQKRRHEEPEKCLAAGRKSMLKHKDRRRSESRQWVLKNKHKTQSYWAMRKARKASATPVWADRSFIENMYLCSRLCTEATGIKHHVDHIIPLYSSLVCGLHISENLQVIAASQNTAKSNRHWPDMPV